MKDVTMVQQVIKEVSMNTGISIEDIISGRRQAHIVKAKQMVMWVCQYYTRATTTTIARELNLKNHATVLWGTKQIDNIMYFDKAFGLQMHEFAKNAVKNG
jgi:chromosomal replication initiation ATPase DnaA